MYRGSAPSPVTTTPCIPEDANKKDVLTNGLESLIDFPKTSYIEVLLEFDEIKNLPEIHKGKVNVLFSKAQPDGIFNVKRTLTILSESGQKKVINAAGDEIINMDMLDMRDLKRTKGIEEKSTTEELYGLTKAGETLVVGKLLGKEWSPLDSLWSLKLQNSNHLLLTGPHMAKLIPGRKLDYEPKHHDKRRNERNFMTAAEFSAEHPYGKAVALLDLKSGILTEEWFALVGIVSACIASKHFQKGRV